MNKKLVYIAGPYRAQTEWQVTCNVRRAAQVAEKVWRMGAVAVCPHTMTAGIGGMLAGGDQELMDGLIELMWRCDAVYFLPEWRRSEGCRAEYRAAKVIGLAIFECDLAQLEQWIFDRSVAVAM